LVLAGDIWFGSKFIQHEILHQKFSWIRLVAERFKQVLIVLGNHDYWHFGGLTIMNGADKCNDLLVAENIDNVRVLDCDAVSVDDWLFVGCTLWTDMNRYSPLVMMAMRSTMIYDSKISYETGRHVGRQAFTSNKWVETHLRHKHYIEIVARQNLDKKLIVVSHHVPLHLLSDPAFVGQESSYYYSSDLSDLVLDNGNIRYWLYGHSHWRNDYRLGECRLVNNCVGYKKDVAADGRAGGFVIELDG
jgi:hypothetical protein